MTQEQVKPRRRRPRRHRRQTRPRELPEIFFCGDPHGGFDQINEAARLYKPDAMVILGDLQPPAPLDQVLEEALACTEIWWIPGNHDTDTDEIYDYLWRSELAGHNLHGRVANVAGLRIGGLGGVFRGQVWMPDGNPNYYSPATFMRRVGINNIWRGGVPRRHRSTIFPSVYGNLLRQKADILVTHEAPGCHKKGFPAIDRLAKSLGAKWLFHGHQHEDREYGTHASVFTRAVGYRGVVNLQGEVVISAQLDPREEAALQAPQAHGRTRKALAGREAHAGRALVPGGDIGPHLGGAARPRRERFRHLPCRGVGIPGMRASGAQEGRKAAQAPWKAQAQEGEPGAQGQGAHNP